MNFKILRKPRYSILNLVVFFLVGLVAASVTSYNAMQKDRIWVRNAVLVTPLPKVVAAPSVIISDKEAYKKKYEFSEDWFTTRIPAWRKLLIPFKDKPNLNYLEVGVYEGRSLIWMLENILTGPTAQATAIDIFNGPFKDTYERNVKHSGAADKVTTITGYSQVVLRTLPLDSFDIVYIDGSHHTSDVLEDAVLSWRLLKEGGLMIFDDYMDCQPSREGRGETECAKLAIDPFVQCFKDRCEVVHNEWQLIIRKKRAD